MNAMPEAYTDHEYAAREEANLLALVNETPESRVARGLAWLDDHAPAGWRQRIDLDTLEVGSIRVCPAGQAFNEPDDDALSYPWGRAEAILRETEPFSAPETAQLFGFCALTEHGFTDSADLDALNAEWKRVLA